MTIQVCENGVRLPCFVPCLENVCAAAGNKMSLTDWDTDNPKYVCQREGCEFQRNPKPARELTYWHANPEKKRRRDADYGPTQDDFDRSIQGG